MLGFCSEGVGFSLVLIGMSALVGPEGLHHAIMFGVVVALAILAVVVLMGLRASRGTKRALTPCIGPA
ncbi:MAG: hypothetical protein R3E66_05130 [bacterium]